MKTYAFLNKKEFSANDIERLEKIGAEIFYNKDISEVKELFDSEEEKILLLQWTGLRTQGHAPLSVLSRIKNLKSVCLSTTAYSWVDIEGLRDLNVDVCNTPGKSTDSVAEYYYFMTIALLRKLPLALQNGNKEVEGIFGREAKGLKAGIIGMGRIGRKYADICSMNGLEVIYWNRTEINTSYKKVDLDYLFNNSDIIFVALAGNKDTNKLISERHILSMKSDACLLNCAEDTLLNMELVIDLVADNKIGGFAFESSRSNFKGNVFSSPSIAYYTKNTLENESRIMVDTVILYIEGNSINIVN
jgi:glycerate dehydrogenase